MSKSAVQLLYLFFKLGVLETMSCVIGPEINCLASVAIIKCLSRPWLVLQSAVGIVFVKFESKARQSLG